MEIHGRLRGEGQACPPPPRLFSLPSTEQWQSAGYSAYCRCQVEFLHPVATILPRTCKSLYWHVSRMCSVPGVVVVVVVVRKASGSHPLSVVESSDGGQLCIVMGWRRSDSVLQDRSTIHGNQLSTRYRLVCTDHVNLPLVRRGCRFSIPHYNPVKHTPDA